VLRRPAGRGVEDYDWPLFDENAAASLCYTSGTTGNPKGVLYSHRSTVLHAYASALPNVLNVGALDTVLPVVPMFHVNAWGLPYSCLLSGAKLVFPGAALDGKSLYELFEGEGVTFSAGVPTVWLGLVNYVLQNGLRFSTFRRTVIGGAACPPALMDALIDRLGVQVIHGWGMTEMSPLGTTGGLLARHRELPQASAARHPAQAGPRDLRRRHEDRRRGRGRTALGRHNAGHLLVKGPWIVARYFREPQDALQDGWFPTGDVATIDADGFMQITDRSKDVIKSGGEWIGSIDLENIAMAHPAVLQAACIGVPHPKWDERPLLLAVLRPGMTVGSARNCWPSSRARWPRFWRPDDVVFVDSLPMGATGKIQKNRLREQYREHRLHPTSVILGSSDTNE
jgi:acyl-CoA synthetase (AMP-forming)/AMP-acid ligase II